MLRKLTVVFATMGGRHPTGAVEWDAQGRVTRIAGPWGEWYDREDPEDPEQTAYTASFWPVFFVICLLEFPHATLYGMIGLVDW